MKSFFIDVVKQEITEVETDGLKSYYDLIGCEIVECSPYMSETGDCAFVDEEGLLKPIAGGWWFPTFPTPLVGNAVVIGCDYETGETIPPVTITLELLKEKVKFYTLRELLVFANNM
jgi:hypothetical protein